MDLDEFTKLELNDGDMIHISNKRHNVFFGGLAFYGGINTDLQDPRVSWYTECNNPDGRRIENCLSDIDFIRKLKYADDSS